MPPAVENSRHFHQRGRKFALLLMVASSILSSMTAFHYLAVDTDSGEGRDESVGREWMEAQASRALSSIPLVDKILDHRAHSFQPFNVATGANAWDLFVPTLTCPELERVGFFGDGGKWVCGLDSLASLTGGGSSSSPDADVPPCVMYSFGISTDVSFEFEILTRTPCSVFAFDPTIGSLPFHNLPLGPLRNASKDEKFKHRIRFHKVALGVRSGTSEDHALIESLPDIMSRLGHSYVDLVKVDIEGAEWDVFESLRTTSQTSGVRGVREHLPIGQLLIELHYTNMDSIRDFFDLMRSSGLAPFSREINLQPTLVGGPPLASEYSFINPGRFFRSNMATRVAAAVASVITKAPQGQQINAVIYLLIQKSRIDRLQSSLRSLFYHSWKHHPHYPVVLFHEADVGEVEKSSIQALVPNMPLTFANVQFAIPKSMHAPEKIPTKTACAPKSSTLGYRHMCRFHASDVHRHLEELLGLHVEYVWRLDDDSKITSPIGYDVFQYMKINRLRYGFVNTVVDDAACVVGLWEQARHFARNVSHFPLHNESFLGEWPDPLVVYNNFEISHMSLWRSPLWRQFMGFVDDLGGIYMERWGDAPLHTIGISMMLSKKDIHAFIDIGYTHAPFVNQLPRGLPKPHMEDPFNPENCDYYGTWKCGNGTANNRTEASGRGVLFSFGFPGREDLLRASILSFYKNYASSNPTPFIVFYQKGGALDAARIRLGDKVRKGLELHLVPVDLTLEDSATASADRRASLQTCGAADPVARAAAVFLRRDAFDVLAQRGFALAWRFFDDSALLGSVSFNVFERMEKDGKSFAYIETVTGGEKKCLDPLWGLVHAVCSLHRCSPVYKSWGRTKIILTYFGISKTTSVLHPACKALFDAASSSVSYHSDTELHTMCAIMSMEEDELWLIEDMVYKSNWGNAGSLTLTEKSLKDLSGHDRPSQDIPTSLSHLDDLFSPERLGWLGADVATSVPLPSKIDDLRAPPEKLIWLFGDTIVGVADETRRIKDHHSVIANSVGVTTLAPNTDCATGGVRKIERLKYFWRKGNRGNPLPVFDFPIDTCGHLRKESLWPIAGISVVSRHNTVSLVIIAVLACTDSGGLRANPLVFDVPHTVILIVHNPTDPPDEWRFDQKLFPQSTLGAIKLVSLAESNGLAFASDTSTIYVLGTHQKAASSDETTQVMLRIPASKLLDLELDAFQILGSPTKKLSSLQQQQQQPPSWHTFLPTSHLLSFVPHQLFDAAAVSEASLLRQDGQWRVVSLHLLESRFQVCSAREVGLPWRCVFVATLDKPWQRSELITYAGKAHPSLMATQASGEACSGSANSSDTERSGFVVSFVSNSILGPDSLFDPAYSHVYTPKFMQVKWPS